MRVGGNSGRLQVKAKKDLLHRATALLGLRAPASKKNKKDHEEEKIEQESQLLLKKKVGSGGGGELRTRRVALVSLRRENNK